MRMCAVQEQGKTERSHGWSPGDQTDTLGREEVSERERGGPIRNFREGCGATASERKFTGTGWSAE